MAMGGHVDVLVQPWEYVIIGGVALGAFIISKPSGHDQRYGEGYS